MTHASGARPLLAHNPLDLIAQAHVLQEQICDVLERIADGLPDDVDRRLCAQAASYLLYDLPRHHHDEEAGLFPLLRERLESDDGLDAILDRLASEHLIDTDFAGEIAESLDLMGRGERIPNPEMIGYMLRGFFERYRRHVHWENTLIMPLARKRLTEDDLAALAALMARSRAESL